MTTAFIIFSFVMIIAIFIVVMLGLYFLVKMVEISLENSDEEDDR